MKKVLYVTNLPAPYKITFFNLLGKDVELTVIYEREKASNRDDKWKSDIKRNFKEKYLKGKNIGSEASISTEIIAILKRNHYDIVMMNGYSSPTAIIAILYMRMVHIKYSIVCDGMLPTNDCFIKRHLKSFLIKGAAFYLSSGKITDEQLKKYGAQQNEIYRYPFSSISEKDLSNEFINKEIFKRKIGCTSKIMLLYVGQFIERKGIDILFKSIKSLEGDFQLYMVGGAKKQASLFQEYDNPKIKYCGFKTKKELADYYKAADLFLLPTREDIWGLVVNEALAYGVPVITTKNCGAGLELIKNGVNGYIIDYNSTNLRQIINCNLKSLRQACLETAKENTIEKMENCVSRIIYLQ